VTYQKAAVSVMVECGAHLTAREIRCPPTGGRARRSLGEAETKGRSEAESRQRGSFIELDRRRLHRNELLPRSDGLLQHSLSLASSAACRLDSSRAPICRATSFDSKLNSCQHPDPFLSKNAVDGASARLSMWGIISDLICSIAVATKALETLDCASRGSDLP